MSGYLWKYYLENDVENFRRVLETANYTTRAGTHKSNLGLGIGSPGSFGTSPTLTVKGRKEHEPSPAAGGLVLTRTDLNHRDSVGRTLLHLAASSPSENAFDFASALLEHPLTDVYIQDNENGWTPLHRAFYAGNVAIAQAILTRDLQDVMGHGSSIVHHHAGGLIKIKDKEGNGPFDVYEMTLEGDIAAANSQRLRAGDQSDSDDESMPDTADDGSKVRHGLVPHLNLEGDEIYTFGSNQNITLGFGDEDDRQHPERITLRRPDHLYFRFYREHVEATSFLGQAAEARIKSEWVSDLPSIIRDKPIRILNAHMSKLHTVILTDDPESNVYVCGHGPGGRLGVGDETTRYQCVCVEGGALARKKIVTVALGQNHTLALSDQGEIFSWGSNGFGQLGYDLPKTSSRNEEPVQTSPRQIFGPLKREAIIGVAASRIHSVAFTATSLYTFGKNEGQLGIVHSESRSLEIQDTPRNVAASRFSSPIVAVSAIDRATTVLLESHEVQVFSNYGYTRLTFPLDGFTNYFLKSSFLTTKYESSPNCISKVVSSGDTICAMSTSGEIFTVNVSSPSVLAQSKTTSTTNPNRIKNALSQPLRIWSNKKTHMAARDVDIDQNGAIIIVTQAGSVWRRVKRAKIKHGNIAGAGEVKAKDHKYSRIPGLTRVIAVRASGFGAFAAIREDSKKMKTDMTISSSTLWSDLWPLVPFQTLDPSYDGAPSFPKRDLVDFVLRSEDPDQDIGTVIEPRDTPLLPYDLWICSTTSDIEIPVHQFILAGRSRVMRSALEELNESDSFSIPEVLSVQRGSDRRLRLVFQGLDILSTFNLVMYLYTDMVAPVWQSRSKKPQMAFRYRQTRMELLKVANRLELIYLESSLKRVAPTTPNLNKDMDLAYKDSSFFETADIIVQLADDEEEWVHGALICQRCPFFEGLFKGRAAGGWLAQRREELDDDDGAVKVDLSHVKPSIFQLVLRHIYADTGVELFDDLVSDDIDAFLDTVIEVMGVANELMLDRLSEICQKVVGQHVTFRNVCQLLNAIAPCSVTNFKDKALEYICFNLEAVLRHGHLEELEEDVLTELDETSQRLQQSCSIFARSGRAEELLAERYPDLEKRIAQERQSKIDSILLLNKYGDTGPRAPASYRAGSFHEMSSETPLQHKTKRRLSKDIAAGSPSPATSPILKGKRSAHDLIFDMDEEDEEDLTTQSSLTERLREAASPNTKPSTTSVSTQRENSPFLSRFAPPSGVPLSFQRASADAIPSPKDPGRPWGATPLPSSKLNIKEVIEQASSSRTSTLSIGLSAKAPAEPKTSGSFTSKLSQKERKKLMQAQQQGDSSPFLVPEPASASPSPASPWQLSATKQRSVSKTSSEPFLAPGSAPAARTPQLTMRQTIANPSTSSKQDTSATSAAQAAQSRSVSTSQITSSPQPMPKAKQRQGSSSSKAPVNRPATDVPGFAISDKPVPIQSVRHEPQRTKELSLDQRSILDILSEQAIEKTAIKDFAAKRSLQEIQQEQEFQEWWEKESARVIEEEQAAAAMGKRDTGASRGRGKRRGRGGKAEGKKKEKGEQKERGEPANTPVRKAKVKPEHTKVQASC
ncbi:BTB/POZ-like protein [Venturia nashicola]|nr:BTB/POZ-like protein [Venturia nashicola]